MTTTVEPIANLDAEETVLGALLLAGTASVEQASIALECVRAVGLEREHFYRPSHGRLFAGIIGLVEHGLPPDATHVADVLQRDGALHDDGGIDRIRELACLVPAVSNAAHHARLVVEAARRRNEEAVGRALINAAATGGLHDDPMLVGRLRDLLDEPQRHASESSRIIDGWQFVSTTPETIPAIWGERERVVWASGEGLMIVGPDGVGKTSVMQQLLRVRLRGGMLLGLPVPRLDGKALYIAADRPQQAARSLRRMVTADDEEAMRERLVVHLGPLPFEIVKEPPWTLRKFVQGLGATEVYIDSLKDIAIKLSDDEVGGAVNVAFQELIASGIDLAVSHHPRKQQSGGLPPRTLADVYGSRWLTAGAGSVVLLWGEPGDLIVNFKHLKQPAEEVGPFDVLHDHVRGTTTVHDHVDLEALLARAPSGLTVKEAARILSAKDEPTKNEIEKARRKLEGLVRDRKADRQDDLDGVIHYTPREAA